MARRSTDPTQCMSIERTVHAKLQAFQRQLRLRTLSDAVDVLLSRNETPTNTPTSAS